MAASQTLRIVLKSQYDRQLFLPISPLTATLAPSSVRIETKLIGLTSNNLAYCAAGDFLHWWSAFPLPDNTPEPFKDGTKYGVPPGWGYCKVLESSLEEIEPGRFLYGFVPTSGHTVDLQLRKVDAMPDHFIETSPHRTKMMNLYQRYFLMPDSFVMALKTPLVSFTPVMKPIWEAGYLLAKYVFAHDGSQIHPFGSPSSPWTEDDADLTGACVICVAAGTKTSRSFLQQLAMASSQRKPEYEVVEVTSTLSGCEKYLRIPKFQHKVVTYDSITAETFGKYRKFVILNFGGRENAQARVAETVRYSYPSANVVCIQIGGEAKVYTKEDLVARSKMTASLSAVQMNANGIKDEAMKMIGEQNYFDRMNESFENMVNEQVSTYAGTVLGVQLKLSRGLRGEDGVEGLWQRLSSGAVAGDVGLAVHLDE